MGQSKRDQILAFGLFGFVSPCSRREGARTPGHDMIVLLAAGALKSRLASRFFKQRKVASKTDSGLPVGQLSTRHGLAATGTPY